MTPEIITSIKCNLGEGPVWDDQHQQLWWTDINAGKIFSTSMNGLDVQEYDIGDLVGTIGLCTDNRLILATINGFAKFDPESQKLEPIVDPENDLPNNRFNDGKPDPSGGMVAGSMSMKSEPNAGSLYRLDSSRTVTKIRNNVTTSNGLAWNASETVMYYIDTPLLKVIAYDFDQSSGTLSNPRDQFSMSPEYGYPDGMCIDAEGMLWIANYGGSAVRRWNPQNGALLESIDFPASQITCCTFGGPDLSTLFVTSASQNLSDEALAKQPDAGALFKVETPYQGTKAYRFAG